MVLCFASLKWPKNSHCRIRITQSTLLLSQNAFSCNSRKTLVLENVLEHKTFGWTVLVILVMMDKCSES